MDVSPSDKALGRLLSVEDISSTGNLSLCYTKFRSRIVLSLLFVVGVSQRPPPLWASLLRIMHPLLYFLDAREHRPTSRSLSEQAQPTLYSLESVKMSPVWVFYFGDRGPESW